MAGALEVEGGREHLQRPARLHMARVSQPFAKYELHWHRRLQRFPALDSTADHRDVRRNDFQC